MDSMISVGGKLAPETVAQLGEFVTIVFREGRQHGMDSGTIQRALALIEGCVKAENVNITNCVMKTGTRKEEKPSTAMHYSAEEPA
jgi:hypothetical protein